MYASCLALSLRIFIIAIMSFDGCSTQSLVQGGLNVCTRTQSFTESYSQAAQQSFYQQISKQCRVQQGGPWFRYKVCYEQKVAYRTVYKQLYRKAQRTVLLCCSGWAQSGNSCPTPICSKGCAQGVCVKPDNCTCHPGYDGPSCDQACTLGRWDVNCNNTCECQNNSTCDSVQGICNCTSGWQGDACQLPCKSGYYGNSCKQVCQCQNRSRCNHVTGLCRCISGWTGKRCERPCDSGYYGDECKRVCQCMNGATCDHVTGRCTCFAGYKGKHCDKPCDPGYYGDSCKRKCDCLHGTCNHVNGTCKCVAGFTGARCDQRCPVGTYGFDCAKVCACADTEKCSVVSGECTCIAGSCSSSCPCAGNATCEEGNCTCLPGFTGRSCDKPCPVGYYGDSCLHECSCGEKESCDVINGSCTCDSVCDSDASKSEKTISIHNSGLMPGLVSGLAILVILCVAIGYVVYRRRSQQRGDKYSNADNSLPEPRDYRGDSAHKEGKPVYMELTPEVTKGTGSGTPASGRRLSSHYMGLVNEGFSQSNYQPLQRGALCHTDSALYDSTPVNMEDSLYINTAESRMCAEIEHHGTKANTEWESPKPVGESLETPAYLELTGSETCTQDYSEPVYANISRDRQDTYENMPIEAIYEIE
ncbi:multiple epidermal growth factor-like domains protein 10 [Nematostella vectensis]|uniref:multiple epidermal growth factor-like domains protein 10 n=1 Tax=Nematostella vectensis TaxID=45351 RepID=UPI0013906349|nr:multiple epidermal growth factor-like domains protein 10 [Nematostella vectensis]